MINEEFTRKIIHIDMDAFYASVEQMDDPLLRGKPVAVGGNQDRGVVAAASYEAREFGVKSAMSSAVAARRCPQLIFVKPRFERYKEISNQLRAIFYDYTDLFVSTNRLNSRLFAPKLINKQTSRRYAFR